MLYCFIILFLIWTILLRFGILLSWLVAPNLAYNSFILSLSNYEVRLFLVTFSSFISNICICHSSCWRQLVLLLLIIKLFHVETSNFITRGSYHLFRFRKGSMRMFWNIYYLIDQFIFILFFLLILVILELGL